MIELKRRQYKEPAILNAVAQVLLQWQPGQMREFIDGIRQEAFDEFQGVQKNSQQTFELSFSASPTVPELITRPAEGLEITTDEHGSKIIIEPSGYRILLAGPYRGRDYLFKLTDWVQQRLLTSKPEVVATRVSVLYENRIMPVVVEGDLFQIEEYVTPNFEFADKTLNVYDSFMHMVFINVQQFAPGQYRCRLQLSGGMKGPGLHLSIDVLDDTFSAVGEVSARLIRVKDIEDHVFESTITDKTRSLYGVVS